MYHKVKMPTLPLCILLCLGFLFLFKAFFVFRGEIGDLFFEQFQISILNSQAPSIYYVGETEKGTDFDKLCKRLSGNGNGKSGSGVNAPADFK